MSVEKDYYMRAAPLINAVLNLRYERHVTGEDNIPQVAAMYAINHYRIEDSLLVASEITKQTGTPLRFGAKSEYFEGGGLDDHGKLGRSVKWFMENTHQISVERESNPRSFINLKNAAGQAFSRGDSVGLHPEGTRSKDGRLNKFKSGVARIAMAFEVPIVPVGLVYHPPDHRFGRTLVEMNFGEPMMFEDYDTFPYKLLSVAKRAEHVTNVLERRVADLSGQERSHKFAVLPKHDKIIPR